MAVGVAETAAGVDGLDGVVAKVTLATSDCAGVGDEAAKDAGEESRFRNSLVGLISVVRRPLVSE